MRRVVVLPAPLGPDQAEDLALVDAQIDAGDGERAVVALDEALGPDDLGHFTSPVIARSRLNPMTSLFSLTNRMSTVPVAGST